MSTVFISREFFLSNSSSRISLACSAVAIASAMDCLAEGFALVLCLFETFHKFGLVLRIQFHFCDEPHYFVFYSHDCKFLPNLQPAINEKRTALCMLSLGYSISFDLDSPAKPVNEYA